MIPDEEKVARADFAYVNDGTLEELDAFVADVGQPPNGLGKGKLEIRICAKSELHRSHPSVLTTDNTDEHGK